MSSEVRRRAATPSTGPVGKASTLSLRDFISDMSCFNSVVRVTEEVSKCEGFLVLVRPDGEQPEVENRKQTNDVGQKPYIVCIHDRH
jgi:hypothetical protein